MIRVVKAKMRLERKIKGGQVKKKKHFEDHFYEDEILTDCDDTLNT